MSTACTIASLTPSLLAAQSTSRFSKDALVKHGAWDSVDYAILSLLQVHLDRLGTTGSRFTGDAWTEGQAACDILEGILPVVLAVQ